MNLITGASLLALAKSTYLNTNSPFPSCLATSVLKRMILMIFYSHVNKTHFHSKGFALSLILKARVFGTQKWPLLVQFRQVSRKNDVLGAGQGKICRQDYFVIYQIYC